MNELFLRAALASQVQGADLESEHSIQMQSEQEKVLKILVQRCITKASPC